MQYNVPQFVDVEDKIIGPLTLKQFLIMLGGAAVLFFFWSVFDISIIFFVLALPTVGAVAALAFGRFNGRSLVSMLPDFIKFYKNPRYRVYQRIGDHSVMTQKKEIHSQSEKKQQEEQEASTVGRKSRLKELAYVLDQKTLEEDRLIHSGKLEDRWLNQI